MHEEETNAFSQLLADLRPTEREHAATVLAACAKIEVEGGMYPVPGGLRTGSLLFVDEGFVVLRASDPASSRSVITSEAGPGDLVLAPSPDETLVALGRSRLTVLDEHARTQLLELPALAEHIVEQLTRALTQRHRASADLAPTRHVERVRRKLLQLAETHGHVVRDGIRIDFPVSHAFLAEMIASSRETVTRALDELQRAGFVARNGSTYRLLISPKIVSASDQT